MDDSVTIACHVWHVEVVCISAGWNDRAASLFCGIWYAIEAVRSNNRVEATLIEIKERYIKAGICADTSDYMPYIENYGYCFEPIARVGLRKEFLESEQYKYYLENYDISADKLRSAF